MCPLGQEPFSGQERRADWRGGVGALQTRAATAALPARHPPRWIWVGAASGCRVGAPSRCVRLGNHPSHAPPLASTQHSNRVPGGHQALCGPAPRRGAAHSVHQRQERGARGAAPGHRALSRAGAGPGGCWTLQIGWKANVAGGGSIAAGGPRESGSGRGWRVVDDAVGREHRLRVQLQCARSSKKKRLVGSAGLHAHHSSSTAGEGRGA